MVLVAWRARGYVPEVLRELRSLLAPDEEVLGDGAGRISAAWRWQEAFRVVAATDRRLLIVSSPRSSGPFVLADVPYERVERFGIEWRYRLLRPDSSTSTKRAIYAHFVEVAGAPGDSRMVWARRPRRRRDHTAM